MPKKPIDRPTKEDVAKFKMLAPMLHSLLTETRELSKKKPDGTLNQLKVTTINRILKDLKTLLGKDSSIMYLDLLDSETLPQNSDAVIILGQFEAAMTQFQEKHCYYNTLEGDTVWRTTDGNVTSSIHE